MHILEPKIKDLGGFTIQRYIPQVGYKHIGPWVFFDHAGPASFDAGKGIDVRPHPHIGLATVTYLFEGELIHRDSLNIVQPIRPGALNIMIAGKGVVHSERTDADYRRQPHTLHALQLWCALPDMYETCEPSFLHYTSEEIPHYKKDGIQARILMGTAHGKTSPAHAYADALYVEYHINAGRSITLPEAPQRALYLLSGKADMNNDMLEKHMFVVVEEGNIIIHAKTDLHMVLIGGTSVGPRHIDWNFVASDKQLIEEAKLRWKAGDFAHVPGDDEYIPLPDA